MYYWNSYVSPPSQPFTWQTGPRRVGADYNFSPKNPFESAKKLRTIAEKRDEGATFTLNKAGQTHSSGDIQVAFEANTDARKAWQAVLDEVGATLAAIALYEQNPLTDKTYVGDWKAEGALMQTAANARLSFLGQDRAAILTMQGRGAVHPIPGPGGGGGPIVYYPPGQESPAPKSDWDTVAGNAAIVALVSAVVYTGWKLLAKGAA